MLFPHGRRHLCDYVAEFSKEEIDQYWNMFKRKYWGNVDHDTWEANNKALNTGDEIRAIYRNERDMELMAIRINGNITIFYTQKDIDEGIFEKVVDAYSGRNRQRKMSYDFLLSRSSGSNPFG